MPQTRRRILQGAGIGLLSYSLGGRTVLLTPAEARAHGVPLQVLSSDEAATLETLCEALVPGAAEAGVVQFVDQQLSVDANDALLMARYLNVEPPYVNFYREAIAAVHAYSRARYLQPLPRLAQETVVTLIGEFAGEQPPQWEGPPSPLVYILLRGDAVDVAYGTVEGFERLGIPYLPHIVPPSNW